MHFKDEESGCKITRTWAAGGEVLDGGVASNSVLLGQGPVYRRVQGTQVHLTLEHNSTLEMEKNMYRFFLLKKSSLKKILVYKSDWQVN